MRKFLFSAFLFFFGLIFLVFLIANRQPVMISFDPLSGDNPIFAVGPMPLWVALIGTLFVGYIFGALGMWLSGKTLRSKAAARKREILHLQEELQARPEALTPESEKETLPTIQH